MKYYPAIKRNEFESVLVRWMKLEACYTELSQKEKNKCIYMETRKMVLMNLFSGRTRDTDLWTQWEEGRRGWEELTE